MVDRLQEISAEAFERAVVRTVERLFVVARRDGAREIPVIGGEFNSDAPPEQQAELIGDVVRALLCRKWAESECPPWVLPLPLSFDECTALFNGPHAGNRRCSLRAHYGLHLRTLGWHYERAARFEVFCAPDPVGVRRQGHSLRRY